MLVLASLALVLLVSLLVLIVHVLSKNLLSELYWREEAKSQPRDGKEKGGSGSAYRVRLDDRRVAVKNVDLLEGKALGLATKGREVSHDFREEERGDEHTEP